MAGISSPVRAQKRLLRATPLPGAPSCSNLIFPIHAMVLVSLDGFPQMWKRAAMSWRSCASLARDCDAAAISSFEADCSSVAAEMEDV